MFQNKLKHHFLAFILMVILLLLLATIPVSGQDLSTERPATQPGTQPLAPLEVAPGYCSSSGGSTSYEKITDVIFDANLDGTVTITVQVYILNPANCQPGQPCGSYDSSPEYVNLWVDWNGDKVWGTNEKVMDEALTGYGSINYRGTMTAVKQITIPAGATAEPTWLRANLGWGYDPNDPCQSSWSWGNVMDKQVVAGGLKIGDITVKGVGTENEQPETGSPVRLEAVISLPAGYEITKCAWTGKLTPGEGDKTNKCRYEYTPRTGAGPSDDTYGPKHVTLTLTYSHTASGSSGTLTKDADYKVFFKKKGDDANSCAWWKLFSTCEPNWFKYWKANGAVTQLGRTDVIYDASMGANTYGAYYYSTDKIHLGGAAADIHYPSGINVPATGICPGGIFGGARGIDTAAEVVEHEARHKWINHNWDVGGIWAGLTDSDKGNPTASYNDSLPDSYETSTTHTSNNSVDSCSLWKYKDAVYLYYGDNEFAVMNHSNGKTGVPANDWANPGKQTNPIYSHLSATSNDGLMIQSGPAYANSYFSPQSDPMFGELASLTGSYSDLGVDLNSNGLYDQLKVTVGVKVNESGMYNLVGWLANSTGTQIANASVQQNLTPGNYNQNLLFSGKVIRNAGFNGPYKLLRVELRTAEGDDLVAVVDNPYTTGAYTTTQFENAEARFTGTNSDLGVDTNADGQFDLLRMNVGINVNLAGTYRVTGELQGSAPIVVATKQLAFSAGNQTVQLDFNGKAIYQSRQNGPYQVVALRIENTSGVHMDFRETAYNSNSYTYTQFVHPTTTFNSASFSEQALDVNADSVYEYLRFNFTVVAGAAGKYILLAELDDSSSNMIDSYTKSINLIEGSNSLLIEFPGGPIYSHAVNGPYKLVGLSLIGPDGSILDTLSLAITTQAYSYTSFAKPLLSLTGQYTDAGVDSNSDFKFEQLKITVGLNPGISGNVIAQARLVDKNGKEIQWVQNSMAVTANTPATMNLLFDGTLIFANQVDGPYLLKNLLVYNSADPEQSVSQEIAYQTAAYKYTVFGSGLVNPVRVMLPIITNHPQVGFNTQFNGSTSNWAAVNGGWWVDSNNYLANSLANTFVTASFNGRNYTNFDYQVRMRRMGCDTCANTIIIRGVINPLRSNGIWNTGIFLEYTNSGYYSIWVCESGDDPYALVDWTTSSAINSGENWNVLRVVANGSGLDFYINGSFVWSGITSLNTKGLVGLGLYSNTNGDTLYVDWATLTVGASTGATHPAQLQLSVPVAKPGKMEESGK